MLTYSLFRRLSCKRKKKDFYLVELTASLSVDSLPLVLDIGKHELSHPAENTSGLNLNRLNSIFVLTRV